jgi:hypothetical protein
MTAFAAAVRPLDNRIALPVFRRDPEPFLKLPAGRTIGPLTDVTVDGDGCVWAIHIPLYPTSGGQLDDATRASRLPPVMQFDADGNYLRGWGGPDHLPRDDP